MPSVGMGCLCNNGTLTTAECKTMRRLLPGDSPISLRVQSTQVWGVKGFYVGSFHWDWEQISYSRVLGPWW